jgi:hypothetical protein
MVASTSLSSTRLAMIPASVSVSGLNVIISKLRKLFCNLYQFGVWGLEFGVI